MRVIEIVIRDSAIVSLHEQLGSFCHEFVSPVLQALITHFQHTSRAAGTMFRLYELVTSAVEQ
jgi:hypothetical protein